MNSYRRINNSVGWTVFLLSVLVYWSTAESSASFWDCGEFLSCAYKLQVPHSPGSPLFILLAHLCMQFSPDKQHLALTVNYFSGVMSALTNMFLCWTVTAMGLKIAKKQNSIPSNATIVCIMAAGVVAAFANGFADSFWFSAVEAEVYASSGFFTALALWSIFKWERVAGKPYADRWIVFIGYVIGLAIGVHLLGILTIPSMVFVYYFTKYKVTTWGMIKTFLIACGLTGFVQYVVIQEIPSLAAQLDILFVNNFGLPFNSGTFFFFILLIGGLIYGLIYTQRRKKYEWNLAFLTLTFIIIGYSSYVMVVIRANADPSIDMGDPDNPLKLLSYLNREQYGDRPLFYGPSYAAIPTDVNRTSGESIYSRGKTKYDLLGRKPVISYNDADEMLFPRIWDNNDPNHIHFYQNWLGLKKDDKPTMGNNLNFFFTYQIGFMFWRYMMWNFSGRQNDIQGSGDIANGNWITGIPFIDNAILGDQQHLPYPQNENKGTNKFFLIPLILGLIGAIYHFKQNKNDAFVVLLLFFFTGLAIVLYLNQTPIQPRERDYSFTGSIYAFAMWIGLSVFSIFDFLKTRTKPVAAASIASLIAVTGPAIMGEQGWDDHDRHNRYTCRDFGKDYLESCAQNAILFTQGDNDTYPLWYAQEVEGIRPDIRIVNLSLLGVDWYIDNLRRKVNNSDIIKLDCDSDSYRGPVRDYLRYYQNQAINQSQYYPLQSILQFILSNDPKKMLTTEEGEQLNYVPARNVFIPVDKKEVIANNVVPVEDTSKIVPRIDWHLNKSTLLKNDWVCLDILQNNLWTRPIYFAISITPDSYLGLNDYLQQEGLAYRLVPYKTKNSADSYIGGVEPDIMFDNMMHKFAWGGVDKYNVYLDENILRMETNMRSNFVRLANALIVEGKKDSAVQALDKAQDVLPQRNVPLNYWSYEVARSYYRAGAFDKGSGLMKKVNDMYAGQLAYYSTLDPDKRKYFVTPINEGVYVLNQIAATTLQAGDSTLNKTAQANFNKYMNMYVEENPQGSADQ